MGRLATLAASLGGRTSARSLERACENPAEAQAAVLRSLLRRNAGTAFGRDHGLTGEDSAAEFRRKVPVRDYEGLRPYVERAARGEDRVLTRDPPVFFARTSGTTAEPKLIPVTAGSAAADSRLMRQWVHRAWRDHPGFLAGDIFTVVSPAVEERAASGIPVGSASGFIARGIPALLRRSYCVPDEVSAIPEYHIRYLAMLRLGLARRVTHVSTPNPSTLARLAELGAAHAEDLIRAVRDGKLLPGSAGLAAGEALRALEASLRPDPARAADLERLAARRGRLAPMDYWPGLVLVGCWTGGSVGESAARLAEWYGAVPVRDLGYVASEGRFTVTDADGTPAGIPALEGCYFEFLPEDGPEARVLGIEELENGGVYRLVITTAGGLWRYDIQDVVRVEGFHGRAPLLAFARKGKDMASITGEKLHANQVLAAMAAMAGPMMAAGRRIRQFRVAADSAQARYRVYLEPEYADSGETWGADWVEALDRGLQDQNIEYRQKRESGRLRAPCLHLMAKGWSEGLFRAWIRSGRRDAQYKWQVLAQAPDASFEMEIAATVESRKAD